MITPVSRGGAVPRLIENPYMGADINDLLNMDVDETLSPREIVSELQNYIDALDGRKDRDLVEEAVCKELIKPFIRYSAILALQEFLPPEPGEDDESESTLLFSIEDLEAVIGAMIQWTDEGFPEGCKYHLAHGPKAKAFQDYKDDWEDGIDPLIDDIARIGQEQHPGAWDGTLRQKVQDFSDRFGEHFLPPSGGSGGTKRKRGA
jgi:hypothetical protein